MLLKDEVQKLDEFLFLQVGERLEDALSDLLLQRRRVGHARATIGGFSVISVLRCYSWFRVRVRITAWALGTRLTKLLSLAHPGLWRAP